MPEPFDIEHLKLPEDSEFHQLLDRCPEIEKIRFRDGEYLIREGEECMDVFLVLQGSYVVEPSGPAREEQPRDALAIITSGPDAPSFVGEMAYLGSEPRSASVRSSMASYTLCLKPEHLDIIINEFPLFTRILCQQFSTRLNETTAALRESHDRLYMDVERVFAQPGQMLIEQGQQADTLYQLIDGTLVRAEAGQVKSLAPQDMFMGFVEPGPYFFDGVYGATVKAETSAILAAISHASKVAVVRNFPELLIHLYRNAVSGP